MKTLLPIFALLMLSACGPVFFVEAELPEVCKVFADQQFEAAPPGFTGSFSYPSMSFDFGNQLPSFISDPKFKGHLNVLTEQLTAKSGVADLSFIDAAHMDLQPPSGSTLTPITVVNYTRAPNAPATATIDLADPSHPDVFPFIQAGGLEGSFSLTGTLPSVPWSVDIRVCISADAKYQYL